MPIGFHANELIHFLAIRNNQSDDEFRLQSNTEEFPSYELISPNDREIFHLMPDLQDFAIEMESMEIRSHFYTLNAMVVRSMNQLTDYQTFLECERSTANRIPCIR
jgi:hypothetical protein